jgi:hypothetical protein
MEHKGYTKRRLASSKILQLSRVVQLAAVYHPVQLFFFKDLYCCSESHPANPKCTAKTRDG